MVITAVISGEITRGFELEEVVPTRMDRPLLEKMDPKPMTEAGILWFNLLQPLQPD